MTSARVCGRLLSCAALAGAAATCGSPTGASDAVRTITVVLARAQQDAATTAPAPPYVTVVDSVHLVVTSPSGATLATAGQRLQRYQTSVSLPVEVRGDAATFRAQVLSTNGTVIYQGSTSVTFEPNDFTVVLQTPAVRPVLLATPDTARAQFDSAVTRGSLAIHNRGSQPLVWSVVADAVFAQCQTCRVTPSAGSTPAGAADSLRISIPSAPPFSSRVFNFVIRSAEGDVSVQWQLSPLPVVGVAVSSTDVLLQVGRTEQLSSTVQVSGTASKAVLWFTSNPNIVGVSTTGAAIGRSPGVATITAISAVDSSKRANALVRVFDPAQKLSFVWVVTDPPRPVVVRRDDRRLGVDTVSIRAAAQGPSATFQNPMTTRVEFWVQRPGASWRLIGQTFSPSVVDNGLVRSWLFPVVWNPSPSDAPYPNQSSTRLNVIAIGLAANGAVYPTPADTNITVTVP